MPVIALRMLGATTKQSLRWWCSIRWAVLLVAVVLVDAKRGRCYASRASLVAQTPVLQDGGDFIPDIASSSSGQASPYLSWVSNQDLLHREKRTLYDATQEHARADLWFINLVERNNISMQLLGKRSVLKYSRLEYGDIRFQSALVDLEDTVYVAETGIYGHVLENRTQVIKAIYGRLPHRSVWYIVASSHYEVTHHNTYEDVSLAIAPIITDPDLSAVFRDYPEYQGRELRKKASLFLYSTFLTPENPDKGVDIWGLRKDSSDVNGYKIIRFQSRLLRYHASTFFVDPGLYEIKVVLHGDIEKDVYHSHTTFKNIQSLIPDERRFVEMKASNQTTVIIGGQATGHYEPQLIALAPGKAPTFDYPELPFFIFNAYPTQPHQEVRTGFCLNENRRFEKWAHLEYQDLKVIPVSAKRDDRFALSLFDSGANSAKGAEALQLRLESLDVDVPFSHGWCAMITEQREDFSLAHSFNCIEDDGTPANNESWILAYNGLMSYRHDIDILFKSSTDGQSSSMARVVKVDAMHHRGYSIASVKPGFHLVKVVPRDSILIVGHWDAVISLVHEECVNVSGVYPESISLAVVHGGNKLPDGGQVPPAFSLRTSKGEVSNVDMKYCIPQELCTDCTSATVEPLSTVVVKGTIKPSSAPPPASPVSALVVSAAMLLMLLLR